MHNNKSRTTLLIVAAIALLLLAIGGVTYALMQSVVPTEPKKQDTVAKPKPLTGPANPEYKDPEPLLPTIVFTNQGFAQPSYTFPAGMAIRVHNQSSKDMQFSSDDHPTHRKTPELNMEVLPAGESGTFTPPAKGTYGFHDHINARYKGALIIQ